MPDCSAAPSRRGTERVGVLTGHCSRFIDVASTSVGGVGEDALAPAGIGEAANKLPGLTFPAPVTSKVFESGCAVMNS